MTLLTSPARRTALGSALAVAAVTALVPLTQAHAADPALTWTAARAWPGDNPSGDALLSAGPTGHVLAVSANGHASREVTATSVSGAGQVGGMVTWLPNGDAIIVKYVGDQYVYRFANGTVGGTASSASDAVSMAANSNELLVATQFGASRIDVQSFAIGAGGTLTANGAAVPVITAEPSNFPNTVGIALDPDGTAEVVAQVYLNNGDTIALESASGTMSGTGTDRLRTWHTPVVIDDKLGNGAQVASADGRIVATWSDSNGTTSEDLYAAVRNPGSATSAKQQLASIATPAGSFAQYQSLKAAAGPDGTLAVAAVPYYCADQQIATVASASARWWTAAPGSTGLSGGTIAGSTWSTTHRSGVSALAAGHGEALVGVHDTDVNSDTTGTYNFASCGAQPGAGKQTLTNADRAVLTAGSTHLFGTGGAESGPQGGGFNHDVSITSASLDANGYAAVVGALDTSGVVQVATLGPVGGATPTSPASPTPSTSASASASPSPSPSAPPKQKGATITTVTVPDVFDGSQTLYATNTTTGQENLSIAEQAYASGLTTQAPHLAAASKPKLVTIASAKVTIKPHKKAKITLHLSAKAKKVLKAKGKLKVILTITTKAKGYATKVTTKTITLKQGTKR